MKNNISIDSLNTHLFEAANEKIDVDTAKTIADLGKVVIEGYKVKAQVLNIMAKTDNPNSTKQLLGGAGIISQELQIEQ